MQIGDLVRIKQGSRKGKLAIVSGIDPRTIPKREIIRVVCGWGDWFGYYRKDLEALCK